MVVAAANVVVKVVMVLVRALEQIRSRAPSCLVLLFLLLPPVSFFSFLSFFMLSLSLCPIQFSVIFSPSFYLFGFVSLFFFNFSFSVLISLLSFSISGSIGEQNEMSLIKTITLL